jgi:hypothetical protein
LHSSAHLGHHSHDGGELVVDPVLGRTIQSP